MCFYYVVILPHKFAILGESNSDFWIFIKTLFKSSPLPGHLVGWDPGSRCVALVIPKMTDLQRAQRWPHCVNVSQLLRCDGKSTCFRVKRFSLSFGSASYISCLQWESLYFPIVLKINWENMYERSRHIVGAWPTLIYSQCLFIVLGGLCFLFLLLCNEPHKMQWLRRTICCYLSQLSGLTRFSWVVLPFPMKLVGATVIWQLDWTGLSEKAPSHDWMLRWPVFRASVLFLWPLHMARLHFSRGVFILTGSVLWVSVPRRRKWTLSVLLCSDLKILRAWLLLGCIGQSSPSATLDLRRGHDSVGSGHVHAGVRD